MDIFTITALVLAAAAVGLSFIPQFPAVVAGWLALLCAHLGGFPFINSKVLIFWGAASIIVIMLGILQPKVLTPTRSGQGYVVGGATVGAILGLLAANVTASIIAGSIIGAVLGAVAYMRTPKSPRLKLTSPLFVQYLCAKGLPAVVSCSMAAIVVALVL